MAMLAKLCMSCARQKCEQFSVKQSKHILQELKVADPLRFAYWEAQLHQLLDLKSAYAD